jgi:transcriptional regulator with XRE-family HTH domain
MSDLDLKEQNNVRATLSFLRGQMGGSGVLAKALRFEPQTVNYVMSGRGTVSASMAFRVARLLDASVDDLLAGRYRPGACPKCGHMPSYLPQSDFADESTTIEDAPRPAIGGGLALVK